MVKIMDGEIIGRRSYAFKDDKGKEVTGMTLYCSLIQTGVEGVGCGWASVTDRYAAEHDCSLGAPIKVALVDGKCQVVSDG